MCSSFKCDVFSAWSPARFKAHGRAARDNSRERDLAAIGWILLGLSAPPSGEQSMGAPGLIVP